MVLIPACNRTLGDHTYQVAGDKYVEAVRLAGCQPLIVPTTAASADELDSLLDLADGVLLTGSASNVHPRHFGEAVHDAALPLDPARDAWTLPLIPRVLACGIPLLAICRGFQEVNVALGGSLHQAVQEVPGKTDHRDAADAPLAVQYGPAHELAVAPGDIVTFFVDENISRTGRTHMGSPTFALQQATKDRLVLMPLRTDIAMAAQARLSRAQLRFMLPPVQQDNSKAGL